VLGGSACQQDGDALAQADAGLGDAERLTALGGRGGLGE
jgi:hypothetical protein